MDLESIMLNEYQRQIPFDFTHMWNLKGLKKTKLIDTEIRVVVTRGKQGRGEEG